jgi:molecular chaperone HtpG
VAPIDTGDDEEEEKSDAAVDEETGEKIEAEEVKDGEEDAEGDKEKEEKIVYYVTDEKQQSQYINMFRQAGMKAVVLTDNIDQPFLQQLESRNEGVKFLRIDADVTEAMKGKTSKKDTEKYSKIAESVQKTLRKRLGKEKLQVRVDKLKNKKVSAVITLSEDTRRMQDMMKMYAQKGMGDMDMFGGDDGAILTLNAAHPLVKYIMENEGSSKAELIEEQLYDLAMISNKQLSADDMTRFVNRSNEIMLELTK